MSKKVILSLFAALSFAFAFASHIEVDENGVEIIVPDPFEPSETTTWKEVPDNTPVISLIEGVAAGSFRIMGDEYVYAPNGFGDFTYTGGRPELIEAIGDTQPEAYSYDSDYSEYYLSFYYNGQYWYGNAYAHVNTPEVEFNCYTDYYDSDLGEYIYDYATITARRTVTSWSRKNPSDTFAHQSDLTTLKTRVDTVMTGETLRMRNNGINEYGSGYAYLQKPLNSDFRTWRIRAPKCTVSGLTRSTSLSSTLKKTDGTSVGKSVLLYPLTLNSDYCKSKLTITSTQGAKGSDGVQLANFKLGLFRKSLASEDAGFCINYELENILQSPRRFVVRPVGYGSAVEYQFNGETRHGYEVFFPVDEFRSSTSSSLSYVYRCRVLHAFIRDEPIEVDNTVTVNVDIISRDIYSTGYTSSSYDVSNVCRTETFTFAFSTYQDDNYYVPESRVITSDTANMFYDDVRKGTWRMEIRDGCIYTELVSDKDFRKEIL